MELLCGSLSGDIESLPSYEVYYGEGDQGEVRVYFDRTLTAWEISQVEVELISNGVTLVQPIEQVSQCLRIKFEKRQEQLSFISDAIAGLATMGSSVIAWQLFKSPWLSIPLWVWVAGGAAAVYLVMRGKREVTKAGKSYLSRRPKNG